MFNFHQLTKMYDNNFNSIFLLIIHKLVEYFVSFY
jgi:hypothetical protein